MSPEELELWQDANPRDRVGLIALAAWLGVEPEQLPARLRLHTCPATKAAWARVERAVAAECMRRIMDTMFAVPLDDKP